MFIRTFDTMPASERQYHDGTRRWADDYVSPEDKTERFIRAQRSAYRQGEREETHDDSNCELS